MAPLRVATTMLCLLSAGVWLGCGSGDSDDDSRSASEQKKSKEPVSDPTPPRPLIAGPIGEALPPLDDGRLVVSLPKGWNDKRKVSKQDAGKLQPLVAMAGRENFEFPNIIIRVGEYKDLQRVTDANLERFARQRKSAIAGELEEIGKRTGKKPPKLLGEVIPIKLESFRGVEYMKRGVKRGAEGRTGQRLEALYLETVVDGRLYVIELQTLEPDITKYRECALAVAVSAKFPKAKSAE